LGYLFLLRKNLKSFILIAFLLLLVKENMGIHIIGFGMLWAYYHKEYLRGFVISVFGILAAYLIVAQLMPYLLGSEEHAMLAKGTSVINRYFWIFEPYDEMKKYLYKIFFGSPHFLFYLLFLFGSFLY